MKRLILSLVAAPVAAVCLISAIAPRAPRTTWTKTTIAVGTGSNDQLLTEPLGKFVGDFNNDGEMDIAVGGGSMTNPPTGTTGIYYWSRNLGGSWARVTVYAPSSAEDWATNGAVGDINGDGRDDIIFTKVTGALNFPNEVHWFEQPAGAGGTWINHTVGTAHVHDIVTADIDHDGYLDIVTCGFNPAFDQTHWYQTELTVCFQDAGGGWTITRLWASYYTTYGNFNRNLMHSGLAVGNIAGTTGGTYYTDIVQGTRWFKNPGGTSSNIRTIANWPTYNSGTGWVDGYRFCLDRKDKAYPPQGTGENERTNWIVDMDADGRNDILMGNSEWTWSATTPPPNGPGDLRLYMNPSSTTTREADGGWGNGHSIGSGLGMLHGVKTLCIDAGNSMPDIVTSEMEQTDGGRTRNVLAWIVTWNAGTPTFTADHVDTNNPGGHEVGVWLEGSTPFVFSANHGRGNSGQNKGTVELRIYSGS